MLTSTTLYHHFILVLVFFTSFNDVITEDDVKLDLGNVDPSLNLDGSKRTLPPVTAEPKVLTTVDPLKPVDPAATTEPANKINEPVLNITVFGFASCSDNAFCNFHGVCLVKLSNLTARSCRCHKSWEGVQCSIEGGKVEVKMENYIIYGLAIVGGLIFLVLFVVACHCYKKAGQIKRKKRLESKHSVNTYPSEDYTGGHKNQAYDNESSSQADSNDSTSKYDGESKSETSSNRVFHFNLNNDKKDKKDKKESKPTDHVIVEIDNNNTQMASSVDSGAPISLRSSPDILSMPVDDDESLSSNRFSNDQITVTDRSDSPNSDESFPKRKQSMDDIYNDYYKKRLSHQQEMKDLEHHRRKSVDLDIVSSDYNPYMYYTTPNRGKNRHTKPIDQQLPQPMHPKHNYKQVKAGVKPRQRKHSEDVLRSNYPQNKMAAMRSNSLGDLTLVGVNSNYQRQSSSTLNLTSTFGSSSHIANIHTGRKTSTTHLISPKDKGSRGIWASSNQRI